jgi:hypothetical protein
MNIQLEFALAQKCDLMIMGNSGYGDMVYNHMCCGFPLHDRGKVPQRCICPPKVRMEQSGFTCEKGNVLLCGDVFRGGDITKKLDDPSNMAGANFSKTKSAIKQDTRVLLTPRTPTFGHFLLSTINHPVVNKSVHECAVEAFSQVCLTSYDSGPEKPSICG